MAYIVYNVQMVQLIPLKYYIIIIIIIIKFTSLDTGGHTLEAEPVQGAYP